MSALDALRTSLSGMNAQSTKLAGISNNIANSSTVGYKRVSTQFESLVIEGSGSGAYAMAGTAAHNRVAIGQVGQVQRTGVDTDIAVNGSGFIVVNDHAASDGKYLVTRAGSFRTDQYGNLVNSAGYFLQGVKLDASGNPIGSLGDNNVNSLTSVNINSVSASAAPTTEMKFWANLPSDKTGVLNPAPGIHDFETSVDYYDGLGKAQTLTYQFNPVAPTLNAPVTPTFTNSAATTRQVNLASIVATAGNTVKATFNLNGTPTTISQVSAATTMSAAEADTFVGNINNAAGFKFAYKNAAGDIRFDQSLLPASSTITGFKVVDFTGAPATDISAASTSSGRLYDPGALAANERAETLSFTLTDVGGTSRTVSVARQNSGETTGAMLSRLATAINNSTGVGAGRDIASVDPSGKLLVDATRAANAAVTVGATPLQVTTVSMPYVTNQWTLKIFDSAAASPGTAIGQVNLAFNPTTTGNAVAGTLASVNIVPGGSGIGTGAYNSATGDLTITKGDGTPMTLNIGSYNSAAGMTQYEGDFVTTRVEKDGSAFGLLQRVSVGDDGKVMATFSNGQSRAIYQLKLAMFANPDGLNPIGGDAYEMANSAGALRLLNPGAGAAGTTSGGALEASTVDVGTELTNLIETQRAYSSNATVIRTADQMLEEAANLKR